MKENAHAHRVSTALTSGRAINPVCGMTVDKQAAAGTFEHDGTTYFFCRAHAVWKHSAINRIIGLLTARGDGVTALITTVRTLA